MSQTILDKKQKVHREIDITQEPAIRESITLNPEILHQLDYRVLVEANTRIYDFIRDKANGDENCSTSLEAAGLGGLESICSLCGLDAKTSSVRELRALVSGAVSSYTVGAKESEEIYTIYCVNFQAKEGEESVVSRSYSRPKKLSL